MYVGRIVGVGRTPDGRIAAAYRVSSRSFPNRDAETTGQSVRIVPRSGTPDATSDSPYIAYEALVWDGRFAVVSNGTHTRPIFERLRAGNSPRDAMAGVLMGLDREFDQYDTPRLCGVLDGTSNSLWLGSITATSLTLMPLTVAAGQMAYITTYERPLPSSSQVDSAFDMYQAAAVCQHVVSGSIFADFDKPICAAAAVVQPEGFETATLNVV